MVKKQQNKYYKVNGWKTLSEIGRAITAKGRKEEIFYECLHYFFVPNKEPPCYSGCCIENCGIWSKRRSLIW